MKKLLVLLVFLMLIETSYATSDIPETIMVGLSYGSSAVSEFTVYAKSGVRISDVGTVKGNVKIAKKGTNQLQITTDASSKKYTCAVGKDGISISPYSKKEILKYNSTQYRGSLIVYRFSDSDLTVVNVLGLEEYLYGVVSREMSTGNPKEALKAQAVVARTYACLRMGKYSKWNFDMTNTTLDQAYGGYSVEKYDTNDAVNDTEGEVVTYDGKIVSTPFFSTSGGYTEAQENVWNVPAPYLQPVEDKYQSTTGPNANWSVIFEKSEIEDILEAKNIVIGNLLGINIVEKSESGGVIDLEFVGSKDTYNVTKEKTRTVLGLKSQNYDITSNNYVSVIGKDGKVVSKALPTLRTVKGTKSAIISSKLKTIAVLGNKKTVKYNYSPDEYILNGKGWGHGVGMSQSGAIGMAKAGFDYEEIIKWYYTDVEIEKE